MSRRMPREIHVTQVAVSADTPRMPDGRPAPSVLDEDQAAAFLQIKPRTLRQYRNERLLRGFKYGRAVRYNVEELDRFRKSRQEVDPA